MFDPYVPEIRLQGAPFPLRFMVERQGGPVSQLRSPYSHVIAEAAHRPAGFTRVSLLPGRRAAGRAGTVLVPPARAGAQTSKPPEVGSSVRTALPILLADMLISLYDGATRQERQ